MSAPATAPVAGPATPPDVRTTGFGSSLTGAGRMIRFILRRDRVRIFWWSFSIVLFYVYFMAALGTFDADAMAGRAALMETPSGIAMGGPGYGVEDYTPERAVANEGITWWVIALGIMSIMHMVRHTRTEEESGRSELVRANVVGRHAPAVAAITTLTLVNALIAVLSAGILVAMGGEYVTVADSFALTGGVALASMVFGVVAFVFAQLTVHGRGAVGLSMAVLGAAFFARAAGDMIETHGSPLSWASPFAWAQQMQPFVDLIWWPALLSLAAIVLLLLLGSSLASRRDFGGGLLAERAGHADAASSLAGPVALAWRQQRWALFWSALGLGLMWFATGTMLPDIGDLMSDMVESNPMVGALFGDDPEGFTAAFLGIMLLYGMLCVAAYAIVMGGRAKTEESAGRVEVVLARPLARSTWYGAQLLVAGIGTVVLTAVTVYAMWAGGVVVGSETPTFGDYTEVFWPYIPAVLCYLGFIAALYAWFPKATGLGWLLLVYGFVIGMFGNLLEDLPDAANYPDPMYWLPAAFVDGPEPSHMIGLGVAVVVLFGIAFLGFRRRDIPSA
ncbi:exporter of polyketide antibiotics [Myceligenerans cantabricum]